MITLVGVADGAVMMRLPESSLVSAGVDVVSLALSITQSGITHRLWSFASNCVFAPLLQGSASRAMFFRDTYMQSYLWPPSDGLGIGQTTSSSPPLWIRTYNSAAEPLDVYVEIVLQTLTDVSETTFEFEIGWEMRMRWTDTRIFAECFQAGVVEFDSNDPCRFFFQPRFIWENIVLDPHPRAVAEPKVLSNFGISTELVNRTATTGGRYRGKFMGDFMFQSFPYDTQELLVEIRAPLDMPLNKVRFISSASVAQLDPDETWHPVWDVISASTEDSWTDVFSGGANAGGNGTRCAQISLKVQVGLATRTR